MVDNENSSIFIGNAQSRRPENTSVFIPEKSEPGVYIREKQKQSKFGPEVNYDSLKFQVDNKTGNYLTIRVATGRFYIGLHSITGKLLSEVDVDAGSTVKYLTSAELDWPNKKMLLKLADDTVISCDLTALNTDIRGIETRVTALESKIDGGEII